MQTPHILIVEDELVTRNTLKSIFEAEGYDVFEATDGAEMHQILSEYDINLVIMDINLPGKNGLLLARELRELRLTQRQAEGLRCFLHLISKHRAAPSQSFLFSSSWTSRSRFCCSSQTSSTETSAGETPLMRPAWPTERGRMAASFSRASSRRLGTS